MKKLLLAMVTFATAGHAATLRENVALDHPSVRLSDLWDGLTTAEDRTLGAAPAPGARTIVEAPQLAAIARQFAVDWRPVSGTERSVIERPGMYMPHEQIVDATRTALLAAGIAADADIELPGFTAPMIPQGSDAKPVVTQLAYDAPSGNFSAVLSAVAPGMDAIALRLSGHVTEMTDVLVAARRLLPGDVIAAADIRRGRVRNSAVPTEPARSVTQAVGMTLRRSAPPGAPILLAELGRPVAVRRDDLVAVTLDAGGIALSGQARALEPAAVGDRIHVMNTTSRAVLEAEVTAPGRVRVNAGSTPVSAGPNGAAPVLAWR